MRNATRPDPRLATTIVSLVDEVHAGGSRSASERCSSIRSTGPSRARRSSRPGHGDAVPLVAGDRQPVSGAGSEPDVLRPAEAPERLANRRRSLEFDLGERNAVARGRTAHDASLRRRPAGKTSRPASNRFRVASLPRTADPEAQRDLVGSTRQPIGAGWARGSSGWSSRSPSGTSSASARRPTSPSPGRGRGQLADEPARRVFPTVAVHDPGAAESERRRSCSTPAGWRA